MRLPLIFLLFFLAVAVQAQRRTTAKPDVASETPRPSRSRGRSRFSATQEYQTFKEATPAQSEPTSRRVVSRKRVPDHSEHKTQPKPVATEAMERRSFTVAEAPERRTPRPVTTEAIERRAFKSVQKPLSRPSYEVQEIVDETNHEPFRKVKKTRVLTESKFEAQNFPRRNSIQQQPLASEYPELPRSTSVRTIKKLVHHEPTSSAAPPPELEDSNAIEEPLDTTFKTLVADSISEESVSEETREEILKTIPAITTPRSVEASRPTSGNRRSSVRRNPNTFSEAPTQASRSRTRVRGTRAPEVVFQAAPSTIPSRNSRRRIESSTPLVEGTRKGPSVFSAEFAHSEGRSRTGRKIETFSPEKITLDLSSRGRPNERSRDQISRRKTTTKRSVDDSGKRSNPTPTFSSRGRFRSRDNPPIIDESKLEVLPLFETEPKIVNTEVLARSRSRGGNRADDEAIVTKLKTESNEIEPPAYNSRSRVKESFLTSATENDEKLMKPDRVSVSVNIESRTQADPTPRRSSVVRESVVAEVSEITSRRTVVRRKNNRGVIKAISTEDKPKVVVGKLIPNSRGSKKSEVNLSAIGKKKEGEEIDEADNYPEPFKALIKAKKGKKESRSSPEDLALTNIMTSSFTTARSTSGPVKEVNDQENELVPKSPAPKSLTSRLTRNRSTPSSDRRTVAKKSTIEVKSTAPTLYTTPLSRLNKYKGKHPGLPTRTLTSQKFDRNVSFRPREGYSTERNKKAGFSARRNVNSNGEPIILSTKIPKYSTSFRSSERGKFRNEFSRGAVIRSTTNPPRYIPTIPSAPYIPTVPTVTPPRTTASSWSKDVIDYNWSLSRTI